MDGKQLAAICPAIIHLRLESQIQHFASTAHELLTILRLHLEPTYESPPVEASSVGFQTLKVRIIQQSSMGPNKNPCPRPMLVSYLWHAIVPPSLGCFICLTCKRKLAHRSLFAMHLALIRIHTKATWCAPYTYGYFLTAFEPTLHLSRHI